MRTALMEWLCKRAKSDKSIVLLTADLGFGVVDRYAEEFPDRFFNIGVAEQNTVGVAAGLASEGYQPYTYSIGIFPTFRCAEQIRNDIDYHNLPVVTCAIGSGVTYGALGYTHHMIQDLALMRSLPNTLIGTPADPLEVISLLDWHIQNPCPLYLRLHKANDKIIHSSSPDVKPGTWLPIYQPKTSANSLNNCCVVVAGGLAPKIVDELNSLSSPIPAFSMPLWGQSVRSSQVSQLNQYQHIITVEDHLLDGGFGSWMLETAALYHIETKIHPITLPSTAVGAVACEETLISPLIKNLREILMSFSQH